MAMAASTYTILLMKPHSPEATAQDVWQTIVSQWFTPFDSYRWGFKAPKPTNNTPDSIVLQVIQVIEIPAVKFELIEHPVFIVVCKGPSSDSDTPDWDDIMQVEFIHRISENSNLNSSETERLFGAVAIGQKVKFIDLMGKHGLITDWLGFTRISWIWRRWIDVHRLRV
ncbi:Cytochrome b5 [Penicillium concentricum]|uniref:Cytochrome b5 n=1 Tax=Penicillium concentricum TaxID=293559 RepID=A0A9W9R9S0_9EURO|nr:Cytochrome b5 [Penicillium concentricum]KAJ5356196.1 Cytochrome b5 [Penicillium concentricum]